MSNLSALVGAIVFSWFPECDKSNAPGPKFRPSLVIDADPDSRRICLAYGTSQHTDRNGLGEITFDAEEIKGLSKDTKFCLTKTCWVPVNDAYLSQSKKGGDSIIVGFIPNNRKMQLASRIEEISI